MPTNTSPETGFEGNSGSCIHSTQPERIVVTRRDPLSRALAGVAVGIAAIALGLVGVDIYVRSNNSVQEQINLLRFQLAEAEKVRESDRHYLISHICGLDHALNMVYDKPEYYKNQDECVQEEIRWLHIMREQDKQTTRK